jgi:hypothetical protein
MPPASSSFYHNSRHPRYNPYKHIGTGHLKDQISSQSYYAAGYAGFETVLSQCHAIMRLSMLAVTKSHYQSSQLHWTFKHELELKQILSGRGGERNRVRVPHARPEVVARVHRVLWRPVELDSDEATIADVEEGIEC